MRDDRRISLDNERYSTTSVGILDGNGSRPMSQTSSEMDTLGTSQTIKHREKAKLQVSCNFYFLFCKYFSNNLMNQEIQLSKRISRTHIQVYFDLNFLLLFSFQSDNCFFRELIYKHCYLPLFLY